MSSNSTGNSSPLRIGLLSFAHVHAGSYAQAFGDHPDAALVGIFDEDPHRGAKAANAFRTDFYPQAEKLLAQHLDAVVIASENVKHKPLVDLAAAAGVKAILCEKPVATTLEDARSMIEICDSHDVQLRIAFPCRYSPAYRRVREQVRGGAIGKIIAIRGTNRGSMPGGWFGDPALSGGGAVMDHTVHVADLNRDLLGQEATRVHAEVTNGIHHGGIDDTGFLNITYSGGVFATLDCSWSRPKTYPTWGDVTLQIIGEGGVLDVDLFAQNLTHYDDARNAVRWRNWGSNTDSGLVSDFLKIAAGGSAPDLATGEDGLHALEVALAAYRSAEQGTPVGL